MDCNFLIIVLMVLKSSDITKIGEPPKLTPREEAYWREYWILVRQIQNAWYNNGSPGIYKDFKITHRLYPRLIVVYSLICNPLSCGQITPDGTAVYDGSEWIEYDVPF